MLTEGWFQQKGILIIRITWFCGCWWASFPSHSCHLPVSSGKRGHCGRKGGYTRPQPHELPLPRVNLDAAMLTVLRLPPRMPSLLAMLPSKLHVWAYTTLPPSSWHSHIIAHDQGNHFTANEMEQWLLLMEFTTITVFIIALDNWLDRLTSGMTF